MAALAGLYLSWLQTPEDRFLVTWLINNDELKGMHYSLSCVAVSAFNQQTLDFSAYKAPYVSVSHGPDHHVGTTTRNGSTSTTFRGV